MVKDVVYGEAVCGGEAVGRESGFSLKQSLLSFGRRLPNNQRRPQKFFPFQFILVSLLALSFLSSCGGDDEAPVKNVWCGKTENTLRVTETETLFVMFEPANASNKTVTWRSENPAVATVDENGVVTAVSIGATKMIATTEDGGREAECKREVLAEVAAESVSIITSACATRKMPLGVGEERELHARVEPQSAEQAVIWTSQNPEVATVDRNTGHVTAVSVGEATLVATAEDGNKTATCTVKVSDMADGTIPSITALTPIDSTTFTVTLGGFDEDVDTSQMRLNISPVSGLSFEVEDSFSGGTKTFVTTVHYDGTTAFPDGSVQIDYKLENVPDNYAYDTETQTTVIEIIDGQTRDRPIPVNGGNIAAFNEFANTTNGLKRHYKLIQSVTLTGQNNWTAIGKTATGTTPDIPFTGSFDGGGFTISALNINRASVDAQGLFGFIGTGATVENIGLINISVSGNAYVGGVAGFSNGTVLNSYVTGTVRGSGNYVGGLVGNIYLHGIVENSYSTGSVNGNTHVGGVVGNNYNIVRNSYSTSTVRGTNYVGGVVGNNTNAHNANSIVLNSYSTGTVTGQDCIGGVVGANAGTVQTSHATGAVGGSSSRNNIGGVVGYNTHLVDNSYATGNVSGNGYVGGVVGQNNGGAVRNSRATTGTVKGTSGYVGGVVGYNTGKGTIGSCYSTGSVSSNGGHVGGVVGRNEGGVDACYARGSVSGGSHVGGVAGDNLGSNSVVRASYSTGSVSGVGSYVGGVVGFNSGIVAANYSRSSVSGYNYVGGVVGESYHGGAVQNCYATGNIYGNNHVGGVVGNTYSPMAFSYSTSNVNGNNHVGGVLGDNNGGTVQNCVALNSSVRISANNGAQLGRVVGYVASGTVFYNYARNMTLTYDNGNRNYFPASIREGKNGQTTSNYNTQSFWTGTMHWSFPGIWQWGPNNLPILTGVGGTQNHRLQ